MTDEELKDVAVDFIKKNKQLILETFAHYGQHKSVKVPVSLFMAGSPGAGKTEVSKGLSKNFAPSPIRIDADEIRKMCPGYTGDNAHVFQKAANKGVNILFDYALHESKHCILDATFGYGGAIENITRSLKYKRIVEIWFVYQDLLSAWEFTKIREIEQTRRVSKEVFINSFFRAVENVKNVKDTFGGNIELNLLIKDYNIDREEIFLNITAVDLDQHINCSYTESDLNRLLV